MLRKVRHRHNGPSGQNVTLMLKCGHVTTRQRTTGKLLTNVVCSMCDFLQKERDEDGQKRLRKKKKREHRRLKLLAKVEKQMAKKATASVAKKKDLKKSSTKKVKGTKVNKVKGGRKWFKPSFVFSPKGSLLAKVLKQFAEAEGNTVGENELIAAMEKAGVKPEGKKTVKKLIKGLVRNLSRAGVIVKDRDRKNHPELQDDAEVETDEEDDDDEAVDDDASDDDASDDETVDDDESADDDEDGNGDDPPDENEDNDDASKKKVVKKKAVPKKKK